ncbi:uracil-DNA glycosylase family protein [uncultured Campylobacter sp.]|uniref:uracil-DNA glycosylase family protein n=1 Tax=uncultured Campylobacter sp. TaxID=218934 RepID=UPI0026235D3D|nr:uracil-DNA glycosylase family protein [uncultured Campylobacter sp.]
MLRALYYLKAFGYDFFEKADEDYKYTSYENLKEQIYSCELCSYSKKRKHIFFPRKKKDMKIFIIDSFIKKSENENGIFMSSTQNTKLKTLLKQHLNLEEKDYYISYIYKCFCDEKNDDFALKQCVPYVFAELSLLKPDFILCLGENAFNALGFSDFKRLRGEFFIFFNAWFLPSFDINFITKNPSLEENFIDDLNKIKTFL